MSIPVELPDLADAIARYRFAYLMSSSGEGQAPHVAAVAARLQGAELLIDGIGQRTRANLQQRPAVGLVCPPQSETEYSLIVDGQARVVDDAVWVTPTRAVLHRPAPRPEPQAAGACGSDCVELDPNGATAS